jgi:hypothetical protein
MEELALRLAGEKEKANAIKSAAMEKEQAAQKKAEAARKKAAAEAAAEQKKEQAAQKKAAAEAAAEQKKEQAAQKKAAAEAAAEQKWNEFKSGLSNFFSRYYPYSYGSMGLSVGTTFATPGLTLSPTITIPLARLVYLDLGIYLDLGCDFGFFTNADYIKDLSYNSYYPYIRASIFAPLGDDLGLHTGFGYGYMIADYRFGDYDNRAVVHGFDVAVGFLLGDVIDISYSLRTDSEGVSNKLSIGFVYRFGKD